MGRSWNLDDELDTLLDASRTGSRAERCGELAPLVEVAAALRAELSAMEIDPGVARQHLTRAIGAPRLAQAGPAPVAPSLNGLYGPGPRVGTEIPAQPVAQPVTRLRSRVRRRVTVTALAAALALIPATMMSASSLPGHPLFPLKRPVEQVRPAALAGLVEHGAVGRVPGAVLALQSAVDAAGQAVDQASLGEADSGRGVALRQDLAEVTNHQILQLASVSHRIPSTSPAAEQAIEAANEALVSAKQKLGQQGDPAGQAPPTQPSAP